MTVAIIVLLSELGIGQISWAAMLVILGYLAWKRRDGLANTRLRWMLATFTLIPVIGLRGVFTHQTTDVLRDLWLLSKPALELAFGYAVVRWVGARSALRGLAVAAAIVVGKYLVEILLNLPTYLSLGVREARSVYGAGSMLFIIPPVLLGDRDLRRLTCGTSRWGVRWVAVLASVSLVAMLMSGSRTLAMLTLFYVIVSLASVSRKHSRWISFAAIPTVTVIVAVVLLTENPVSETIFRGTWESAMAEVAVEAYELPEEITANWRGYETYLALRQFEESSWVTKLFGGGVGQRVALEIPIEIGETTFTDIPVLHNGFVYVLTKAGVIGLMLLMIGLFLAWRVIASDDFSGERRTMGLVRWWWLLAVISTTFVISGPYNVSGLLPIMILGGICAAISSHDETGAIPSEKVQPGPPGRPDET